MSDFDEDKYRISVILILMRGQNKGFSHISLHYLFHLKFIIAFGPLPNKTAHTQYPASR